MDLYFQKLKERQQFDAVREGSVMTTRTSGHGSLDLEMDRITMLTRQLLFFYNQNGDDERLVGETFGCEFLEKNISKIVMFDLRFLACRVDQD